MRPLIFGEVLFDHFPDGSAILGGAPFNVAWHLHAFGLKPLMVSRVGDDEAGDKIELAMKTWGMDCSGIQKDSDHATGSVQVTLHDNEPNYEIVDDVAYDHIDPELLPRLDGEWMLYYGSLALRHEQPQRALDVLKHHATRRFVDINLRAPWWQTGDTLCHLEGADWIKLNRQELLEIYPELGSENARIAALAGKVQQHMVLTSGEHGATAISISGGNSVDISPESTVSVVDTVGAGDSFCSVMVAGLILGWPLELTMQRAQTFASAIVGIRGATSQDRAFYQQFIDAWSLGEHTDV